LLDNSSSICGNLPKDIRTSPLTIFIRKDPAVITRDLKEKGKLEKEIENVIKVIKGRILI